MYNKSNMHVKETCGGVGRVCTSWHFCFSRMLARRVVSKLGGASRRFGVTTIEPWAGNPCVVRVTDRPDWARNGD